VDFSIKFFLIAVALSIITGFTSCISYWLVILYHYSARNVWLLNWGLSAVGLIIGVVLPFFAMYSLSHDVKETSAFKPIILSISLGCWIGHLVPYFSNVYVQLLLSGGSYIDDWAWLAPFWHAWQILLIAFSLIFFVSLSGILLVYYRKTLIKKETSEGSP